MNDNARYVFSTSCPACGRRVTQERRRPELCQLLASAADIDAYCIKCDARWKLSENERDRLAHNFMLGEPDYLKDKRG